MSHLSFVCLLLTAAPAADPFSDVVRPTEPLTPAEQQATFHLPPGFEIQLVAAEPDIQKPMNLAFDAAGQLWATGSIEYPYAAKNAPPRDTVKVLADIAPDGRAEKITTFADGLNIPIGLYPYKQGVVVYSIPNIWYLADTHGDGKADHREVLYGPLGDPRDTHGMQNGFRRGFDGWLYINHGFNNESTITGKDGSSITLHSGNTYRVRLDGSRVEQFTWGQVNPFGSTFLADGDCVNADCHSHPLSLLLRGGYYSSFGKPHDGLGIVQPIMEHGHGSTAIAGAAVCTSPRWPAEYQGLLFVGNVMTCRVHTDRLDYRGATMRAVEQPDFLTCDDPWFRPVDLQFGPDGALYIADFYNRIIGHYEVPLDHPQRDRIRARIWRVVYVGEQDTPDQETPSSRSASADVATANLATADLPTLIAALGDSNLTQRMLATDQISDRIGITAGADLTRAATENSNVYRRVHSLWALHRLGRLDPHLLAGAAQDPEWLVRVHAMRMLAEKDDARPEDRRLTVAGLADPQPRVRRAAADALGQHPDEAAIEPLLAALTKTPADDAHLRHTIRIALRNQLRTVGTLERFTTGQLHADHRAALAEIAVAVPTESAARFLFEYLEQVQTPPANLQQLLSHIARHLPADRIEALAAVAQTIASEDLELQRRLLLAIQQTLERRGLPAPEGVRAWAVRTAKKMLASATDANSAWHNISGDNPWGLEPRRSDDGVSGTMFLSSLPGGEQKTGTLRSRPFAAPASLHFYLCGHRGFPDQPASDANYVQLRSVETGEMIVRAYPPRNDVARPMHWDLTKHAGRRVVLELVDGLSLSGYAWLAVARFEPAVVDVPAVSPRMIADRRQAALTLASTLRLTELTDPARQITGSSDLDWPSRAAAAQMLLALQPRDGFDALVPLVADMSTPESLRNSICQAIASPDEVSEETGSVEHLLREAMKASATARQEAIAGQLAASAAGGEMLLQLVEQGHASARLLEQPAIQQKLLAAKVTAGAQRLAKLTAGLPPLDESISQLIEQRIAAYVQATPSLEKGQQLFEKNCAICHQVNGQGALVGPQLDGIGLRGVHRIVEDVLDPNRNVDSAFHTVVLALSDGRVINGLPRRKEDRSLILATAEGKEISVLLDDIESQRTSPLSLMPAGFATALPQAEFADLIGYLLSLRQTRE